MRYGVGAAPWLLATDLLDRHLFSLTRFARVGLGQMLAVYPVLSNVIDARQVRTIRWLEGLGFVVADEPECKKNYKLKRFSKRSA